jgi:peptide/nickel transport system substrate-binding protein
MRSSKRRASACRARGALRQSRCVSRRSLLCGALLGGAAVIASAGAGLDASLAGDRLLTAPLAQSAPRTLTLVTPRAPSDLDPHSAYDAGSGVALHGAFEGLIRLKRGTTDEYEPVLAESWEASADESRWTFRLREGVRFQDGTQLDAFAARASFERLFALGLAPSTVLGRFIPDAAQISAPDRRTLVFDLRQPQSLFLAALAADFGTAIVNVAALLAHEVDGDWGHAWAQTRSVGLGTGPYQITQFDIETGIILERHDGYWRGWEGDHFERVILRVVAEPETRRALIEIGDADIAAVLPLTTVRDLEENPDLVVDRRYNLTVRYLAMTVAGPLALPQARQALCWAFPYDEVIEGVYEGYAKRAVGPVAELCHGFDPGTSVYETDLERARVLLQEAGVAPGTTLSMPLPPGNPEGPSIAELFRTNLETVGLQIEAMSVDFASYVAMLYGDLPAEERPNLLPLFWSPDYNDAWNHLWPQVSCQAWQAGNGGHYCNERVEALLEQTRTAGDEALYRSALGEIQQIVTRDDPAAIYYAQPEWLTVLRRDIGGFTPDLVVGDLVDFYALHRAGRGGA